MTGFSNKKAVPSTWQLHKMRPTAGRVIVMFVRNWFEFWMSLTIDTHFFAYSRFVDGRDKDGNLLLIWHYADKSET